MGARGERVIETAAGEISLLFTNQALAEAEQRMNKSVLSVVRDLLEGRAGIGDVANMLRSGMQEARRDSGRRAETVSLLDAYKVMDEIGFAVVRTAVLEAASDVLTYRPDKETDNADPN